MRRPHVWPLAALLLLSAPAALAASGPSIPGQRGRAVSPTSVRLDALPRAAGRPGLPPSEIHEGEVPMGDMALDLLKRQPGPDASRLPSLTLDSNVGGPSPLAPVLGIG